MKSTTKVAKAELPKELSIESLTPLWTRMLKAHQKKGNRYSSPRYVAAWAMENWYGKSTNINELYSLSQTLNLQLDDVLVTRANARINGTPLPTLPSEAEALKLDGNKILKSIASAPIDKVQTLIDAMDANSLLALSYNLKTNTATKAQLSKAASRIVSTPADLNITAKTLSTNVVQKIIASLNGNTSTNKLSYRIEIKPFLGGASISVTNKATIHKYTLTNWSTQLKPELETGAKADILFYQIRPGNDNLARVHRVDYAQLINKTKPKVKKDNKDLDEVLTSSNDYMIQHRRSIEAKLWPAIEYVCAATNTPLGSASIILNFVPAEIWLKEAEPLLDDDGIDINVDFF